MKKQSARYDLIADELAVGDAVIPSGQPVGGVGRVTKIYHGIGMADVQFNGGNRRIPVEELAFVDEGEHSFAPDHDTTAGGETNDAPFGVRSISTESPHEAFTPVLNDMFYEEALSTKVAQRFVKNALYWAGRDRKYRATKSECGSSYLCPKCGTEMKKAIYKRLEGASDRLWGCPSCMFLIKDSDITRWGGE